MKINTNLFALIAAGTLFQTVGIASAEPEVSVAGIRVIREQAGEKDDRLTPFNTFNKGSALAILVRSETPIIKLDTRASKLDSFTDDKGTDLLVKAKGSYNTPGFSFFDKVSKDGKAAMTEISGDGVPAAGSSKLKAKGMLSITTASKKKAVKSEPFEMKKGTKVTVGDIELTITEVRKSGFSDAETEVSFKSNDKAVTTLASVAFLGADGKDLGTDQTSSGSSGFRNKYTYTKGFNLKKAAKGKVVLQFEVWTDMKTIELPFDVSAGVGG